MFDLAWTESPTHGNFHIRLSSQFRIQLFCFSKAVFMDWKKKTQTQATNQHFLPNVNVQIRAQKLSFCTKMHWHQGCCQWIMKVGLASWHFHNSLGKLWFSTSLWTSKHCMLETLWSIWSGMLNPSQMFVNLNFEMWHNTTSCQVV